MDIKNLAQFKKAMKERHVFEIVEHFNFPERVGERRIVRVLQTNGMYTGNADDPNDKMNKVNNGRGLWMKFGKASDWSFDDGLCQQKIKGQPIWTLRVLDEVR